MTFSLHLDRVASQVKSRPIGSVCTLLVVILAIQLVLVREMAGQHTAIRRLDCSVFCRKTGFSGYVGGCQCGFTLFANKRSHLHPRLLQAPTTKYRLSPSSPHSSQDILSIFRLIYPENSFINDDESGEELEGRPASKDRQVGLGAR